MSSLYGANQSWQFPLDHDLHYGSQSQSQETLFTQESYPTHFLPPSNLNFSSQSQPLAIPHRRQYSGDTTTATASGSSPNQQLDPTYYPAPPPPTQFHSTFSPTTSYLSPSLDPGNTNQSAYYLSSSPQSSVLSDALGTDTGKAVLKSSPTPIHQNFTFAPSNSHSHSHYPSSSATRSPNPKKHPRLDETGLDSEPAPEQKDGTMKTKPAACTRCKALKVRCEMKTDTDPCKRCFNAGQQCVTPGRKKRRTPPKREHLLNQIREQATHIQKLMAQLEERDDRSQPAHRSSTSSSNEPASPVPSSSSYDFSDTNTNPNMNPDVQDWIAKAKESIEAFGGFIGMGGAAIAKSLLVDGDPEDSESSDDYEEEEDEDGVLVNKSKVEDEDDAECEIAVEYSDGEEVPESNRSDWSKINPIRRRTSGSSIGVTSNGTAVLTPVMKKKELTGNVNNQKLSAIPAKTSPWGLMADMLTRKKNLSRKGSDESADMAADGEVGVAHDDFFSASPAPDMKDNLLSQNIVTPQEVEKLFKIYFDYMNISLSLLDPLLYSAKQTYYRSSFLFTVICAIASRYYTERPGLYRQLMHHAQQAAGKALVYGKKSVEVCQGFILLSLYPVPARRWEEDRSWIYLGLAIRVATDLNLHHPVTAKPQNEYHAREMLNRERLWLNCFNLDRSMGSQYGKAPIIKNIDYIACHSEGWWESSEYNIENFDIHICVYNAELRVMSGFNAQIYNDPNHPTGLNKDVDFERLASETDDELVRLSEKWFKTLATTDMSNPQNRFRTGLLRLAYSYARLIALSFGFQHHFSKNHTIENPFFLRCLRAASDVVTTVVDDIATVPNQKLWLRHGPEAQSVFVTFAAAFLVKLLQPKFSSYLTLEKRLEMHTLVQKAIDHLGSPEIAIDNRHGPKLYARFLEGLLASPMARVDIPSNGLKHGDSFSSKKASRRPKSLSSQSPEPERLLEVPAVASYPTNPVVSSSPSPKPSQVALSFDIFAPMLGGHDPFAPAGARTRNSPSTVEVSQNGLGMNVDYFQQPSFDDNFLQSLQALPSDDSMWDIAPTGLDWMSDLHHVGSQDSMFNLGQYPSAH